MTEEKIKKKEEFCSKCLAGPAVAAAVAAAGISQTDNSQKGKMLRYGLIAVAAISAISVVCILLMSSKSKKKK
jgi:hypothetical protein